jgi:hypothetical protein
MNKNTSVTPFIPLIVRGILKAPLFLRYCRKNSPITILEKLTCYN